MSSSETTSATTTATNSELESTLSASLAKLSLTSLPSNLSDFGVLILNTNSTEDKVALTTMAVSLYKQGKITTRPSDISQRLEPPVIPQRPLDVKSVSPNETPRRGVGSVQNRIALIHSIAHMESYAIDLSWDVLCRYSDLAYLPDEYFEDWLRIAEDECRHFGWLNGRLKELGSHYGDLPGHPGLWKAAEKTRLDILARLCILHCVHEARGLDVTPNSITKLQSAQDPSSAELLTKIYDEEISHVESGLKWFQHVCKHQILEERKQQGLEQVDEKQLHELVLNKYYQLARTHFVGGLKPPFNEPAREKAKMTKEWYWPLVEQKETKQ